MIGAPLICSLLLGFIKTREACTDGECSATAATDVLDQEANALNMGLLQETRTMTKLVHGLRDNEIVLINDTIGAMSQFKRRKTHKIADTTSPGVWCLTVPLSASVWTLALFTALVAMYINWYLQACCVADTIMWCGVLVTLVTTINYTIVIPDSFRFSVTLGKTEAYSGKMVGTYMLADIVGAVFVWLLGKIVAECWKNCRQVWVMGLTLNVVGALIYMHVADSIVGAVVEELSTLAWLLLWGRFISGIGNGMCSQTTKSMIPHVVDFSQRPFWAIMTLLSCMVGFGLGPVLAAGAMWLDNFYHLSWRFESAGSLQVVLCFGAVLVVISTKSLQDAADKFTVDFAPQQSEAKESKTSGQQLLVDFNRFDALAPASIIKRRVVVLGSLCLSGLRSFTVSGLEVATALILEETYCWKRIPIGVAIGITLLMAIPLKLLHAQLQSHLKDVHWVRLLASVACLATMLLTSGACHILHVVVPRTSNAHACAWLLLLSDAFLFPSLYLSDGVMVGIMQQHLLWGYFLLDPETVTLLSSLMMASLGRFFGPWNARAIFEVSGLNGFALTQISSTTVFILIFEIVVHPCVLAR